MSSDENKLYVFQSEPLAYSLIIAPPLTTMFVYFYFFGGVIDFSNLAEFLFMYPYIVSISILLGIMINFVRILFHFFRSLLRRVWWEANPPYPKDTKPDIIIRVPIQSYEESIGRVRFHIRLLIFLLATSPLFFIIWAWLSYLDPAIADWIWGNSAVNFFSNLVRDIVPISPELYINDELAQENLLALFVFPSVLSFFLVSNLVFYITPQMHKVHCRFRDSSGSFSDVPIIIAPPRLLYYLGLGSLLWNLIILVAWLVMF